LSSASRLSHLIDKKTQGNADGVWGGSVGVFARWPVGVWKVPVGVPVGCAVGVGCAVVPLGSDHSFSFLCNNLGQDSAGKMPLHSVLHGKYRAYGVHLSPTQALDFACPVSPYRYPLKHNAKSKSIHSRRASLPSYRSLP